MRIATIKKVISVNLNFTAIWYAYDELIASQGMCAQETSLFICFMVPGVRKCANVMDYFWQIYRQSSASRQISFVRFSFQ